MSDTDGLAARRSQKRVDVTARHHRKETEARLALARWLLASAVVVYGGERYLANTSDDDVASARSRSRKRARG